MPATTARRTAARRSGGRSMGPAIRSASASTATVPPFATNVSDRSADEHDQARRDERGKRGGTRRQRAENGRDDGAHVAAEQILEVRVEHERHEEGAADNRHREHQLQHRFGRELDNHEGPVGRRDERSALQRRLQAWCGGDQHLDSSRSRLRVFCGSEVTLPRLAPVHTRGRRPIGIVRLAAAGTAILALWLAAGVAIEVARFGRTDAAAMQRAQREVRESILTIARDTQSVARATADASVMPQPDRDDQPAIRALFDTATRDRALARHPDAVAITIYDARGTVVAWTGRASDLPTDRIRGPASLFVTRSPLGLRLVDVYPIGTAPDGTRVGSVAVEHAVTGAVPGSTIAGAEEPAMHTSVGRVTVRPPGTAATPPARSLSFTVAAADGTPILDATVSARDVAAARTRWRRIVAMVALATGALVVLLMAGPLLDCRAVARRPGTEARVSVSIGLLILTGTALFWVGRSVAAAPEWRSPMALLLGGAAAAALVAAAASGVVRLRIGLRHRRRAVEAHAFRFVLSQLAAGVVVVAALGAIEQVLARAVDAPGIDLRHFSLQPWGGPRLASIAGLLLAHAAALWACALACTVALAMWRLPRHVSRWHVAAVLAWVAPVAVAAALASARGWLLPGAAVLPAAAVVAVAALLSPRLTVWYRHTTVVSRILALFMAFLLPALLIYPSVTFFVDQSMRRLIATQYAVDTVEHPARLLARLNEALAQIDRQQLPANLSGAPTAAPSTDPAFTIWNHTVLASARLTSDVELFDRDGDLVSRFALNFPEYTGAASASAGHPRMPLGRIQRSAAVRRRGAPHAARAAEHLRTRRHRGRRDHRARRLRLRDAAVHHVAVAVLRSAARTGGRRPRRCRTCGRRRRRRLRLEPPAHLRVRTFGVAARRGDVRSHLPIAPAVLDAPREATTPTTTSTSRTIARASTRSAIRSPASSSTSSALPN